ncbi:MAG: hypothetical protein ACKO96_20610, partial [Flammeovirgaceae bacterium]
MKKRGPLEITKELTIFKKKFPNPSLLTDEFEQMRNSISILILSSSKPRAEVAKHLGITENSLFNKMNFPQRWKTTEIKKLT